MVRAASRAAAPSPSAPEEPDQGQGRPPDPDVDWLLAGMRTRVDMAEQHATALEARCTLLDSMLQQHLDSAQDGAALQVQAQMYDMRATLQHLSLRMDMLEQRVAHAVEEGEGRLESVLAALVQALRQQDAMAAHEGQLEELRAAVADLAHKVDVGGRVGRVGSPPTPEGGVGRSPGRVALPSVAEQVMAEWIKREQRH